MRQRKGYVISSVAYCEQCVYSGWGIASDDIGRFSKHLWRRYQEPRFIILPNLCKKAMIIQDIHNFLLKSDKESLPFTAKQWHMDVNMPNK